VEELPKKLNQSSSLETWGYLDFNKNSQNIQKPITILCLNFSSLFHQCTIVAFFFPLLEQPTKIKNKK
jgi:hypothetical protein